MTGGSSASREGPWPWLAAAAAATAAVTWLSWPAGDVRPFEEVSVVTVAPASTAPAVDGPVVERPATAFTADRSMPRDAGNGRIDPPLDRLVAEADGDVHTMHDQIAQQERTPGDGTREREVAAAVAGLSGVTAERVICAGVICEVAGRAADRRAFASEVIADRLARANLSFGPTAFGAPDATGRVLFVQYVNVESDPRGV